MNRIEKVVHKFLEDEMEVVIEMPTTNHEREFSIINEVINMMNNELLLQLNK